LTILHPTQPDPTCCLFYMAHRIMRDSVYFVVILIIPTLTTLSTQVIYCTKYRKHTENRRTKSCWNSNIMSIAFNSIKTVRKHTHLAKRKLGTWSVFSLWQLLSRSQRSNVLMKPCVRLCLQHLTVTTAYAALLHVPVPVSWSMLPLVI